jgi:hypothetical protein
MLVYTEEDLATIGILVDPKSHIFLDGEEFYAGPSFSIKMNTIAERFCHREEEKGGKCLLIKGGGKVSIWIAIVEKNRQEFLRECVDKSIKRESIDICTKELTRCIGPIAQLLIDDALSLDPSLSLEKLVEQIALQIPHKTLSINFQKQMLPYLK